MEKKNEPSITPYKEAPYTRITFLPDYKRFGLDNLTDDLYSIFVKRVYDCALWFSGNMNLTLNPKLKKQETNVNVVLNNNNILCSLTNYVNYYHLYHK